MLSAEKETRIWIWLGGDPNDLLGSAPVINFLRTLTDRQQKKLLAMCTSDKYGVLLKSWVSGGGGSPLTRLLGLKVQGVLDPEHPKHPDYTKILEHVVFPPSPLKTYRDLMDLIDPEHLKYPDYMKVVEPMVLTPSPPKLPRFEDINLRRLDLPLRPAAKWCHRCGNMLHGKYYILERKDLCRRCMRRVRIRQKMLAAKPNTEVRELVKSAMTDLRKAARYDRDNEQIKANLKNIEPLASAAGGSGATFTCFWAPLWLVMRGWDCLISLWGFVASLVGGSIAVVCLWRQGGSIRTAGMVLGAIVGIVLVSGGVRWIGQVWIELRPIDDSIRGATPATGERGTRRLGRDS